MTSVLCHMVTYASTCTFPTQFLQILKMYFPFFGSCNCTLLSLDSSIYFRVLINIGHFGKLIILFVCASKFCISIVIVFSWDHCKSQEKLETMLMQNFGGKTKSIMVFSKVAYTATCIRVHWCLTFTVQVPQYPRIFYIMDCLKEHLLLIVIYCNIN